MKLLADESVDWPIVEQLRQDGHGVTYVAELSPSISDDEVLQRANDEKALLLTADKDFGELIFRQQRLHSGIVLIRLSGVLAESKARIVSELLQTRAAEIVAAFTVVSPGFVRIRRQP